MGSSLLSLAMTTLTIEELLNNAETINRLASLLGSVSRYLSQSVASQWFCRFMKTSLKVLRSRNVLPSLFSFVASLIKQVPISALQQKQSQQKSQASRLESGHLSDDDVTEKPSRKKRVRGWTTAYDVDVPIREAEPPITSSEQSNAAELLTEFCSEVSYRLVQYTDSLRLNALRLLLKAPDRCVSAEIRFNSGNSNMIPLIIDAGLHFLISLFFFVL